MTRSIARLLRQLSFLFVNAVLFRQPRRMPRLSLTKFTYTSTGIRIVRYNVAELYRIVKTKMCYFGNSTARRQTVTVCTADGVSVLDDSLQRQRPFSLELAVVSVSIC